MTEFLKRWWGMPRIVRIGVYAILGCFLTLCAWASPLFFIIGTVIGAIVGHALAGRLE